MARTYCSVETARHSYGCYGLRVRHVLIALLIAMLLALISTPSLSEGGSPQSIQGAEIQADQTNPSARQRAVTGTRIAERPSPAAQVDAPVLRQGKRVALVIGNSAYQEAPLPNAMNDGRDMAAALRELGFEVIPGENLERRAMEDAIITFGEHLQEGALGVFYFAGHGSQVSGVNYLIPIKAQITKEQHISSEAVPLTRVLQVMERAGDEVNIVILDACRNNPFLGSFRSVTRGLAPVLAPKGMLIAYATKPGDVASDGGGRNGLYTEALLQHIRMPGIEILDVFKMVGRTVIEKSANKQVPWINTSLYTDVYLTPSALAEHGHLQVHVNVDAAHVRINGVEEGIARGEAPLRLRHLAVGTLTVRVEADSYEPLERPVTITANQWAQETFVLRRLVAPQGPLTPPAPPVKDPQSGSPAVARPQPEPQEGDEILTFWAPDPKTGQLLPRSQPLEKSPEGSRKPHSK